MHSSVVKRAKLGHPEPWPAHRLGLLGRQRRGRVSEVGKLEIRFAKIVTHRPLRGCDDGEEASRFCSAQAILRILERHASVGRQPQCRKRELIDIRLGLFLLHQIAA